VVPLKGLATPRLATTSGLQISPFCQRSGLLWAAFLRFGREMRVRGLRGAFSISQGMNESPHIESTVQPQTLSPAPSNAPGVSDPGFDPIPARDNINLDALDEYISERERVDRKLRILARWEASGKSARAFSEELAAEGIKASHDSLSLWKKQLKHGKSALERKAYTRRDPKKAQEEAIRLEDQFNYAMGCCTCTGTGFKQARKSLNKVSESLGWGKAMSVHQLRHRWRRMPQWERDYYKMERNKHFKKYSLIARQIGLLPNEMWQMDEIQFSVLAWKKQEFAIYAVACVDRATEVVRSMEYSLCPIHKTAFMRGMKRALLGDPEIGAPAAARPDMITVDHIKFHEPPAVKKTEFDFRLACDALDIIPHWNHMHTPEQNCMVENWNGQFKGTFVPELRSFMRDIAPAHNAQDTLTLLNHVVTLANGFVRAWNTDIDETGHSRIERYHLKAKEGTLNITHSEIDRAVRSTIVRAVGRYGVLISEKEYFVASELEDYVTRKMRIRIRPEGIGEDVDAYFGKEFVATLKRPTAQSGLTQKLDRAYTLQEAKVKAKQEIQIARYRVIKRQTDLKELPAGHPIRELIERNQILDAKRKLRTDKLRKTLAKKKASPPLPPAEVKSDVLGEPTDDKAQTFTAEVL
jgi:hypothetical protein